MSSVPTFNTARLVLREVTEADIPAYQKYFADYNVVRTLAAIVPWPYPDDGVRTFLNTQVFPFQGVSKWFWAINRAEYPNELIGGIGLWREGRPDHRGFWLGHKFWGRGYMTEAVEPVMNFAFDDLGFEKLIFTNAVENSRSARVKIKTGAKLVGRVSAKFVDPTLTESEIYELSKEEWIKFKKKRDRNNAS